MAQIEIKNLTFFYPDMEKGEYLVILIWRYIEESLWLYAVRQGVEKVHF